MREIRRGASGLSSADFLGGELPEVSVVPEIPAVPEVAEASEVTTAPWFTEVSEVAARLARINQSGTIRLSDWATTDRAGPTAAPGPTPRRPP